MPKVRKHFAQRPKEIDKEILKKTFFHQSVGLNL